MRASEQLGKEGKTRRLEVYPPMFISNEVKRQINSILPSHYKARFRAYFDRYGCIRCKRKLVEYSGNGFCIHCLGLISDRLEVIDAKLGFAGKRRPVTSTKKFLSRREAARDLLADFRE